MAKHICKLAACLLFTSVISGCSKAEKRLAPSPDVRINLLSQGLSQNFFQLKENSTCDGQIISYSFVVWLNNDKVVVGFSTSPKCRPTRGTKVDGNARLLVYDIHGELAARRDLPYLADGNGELVAEGSASAGPEGTLLFRIQSVNLLKDGSQESKSAVKLLDADLKDVAQIDGFLEQTTFVKHSLVFQQGFASSGPRTYSILSGIPPVESKHLVVDWPTGTMDRKFGEDHYAFMLCEQELRPGDYSHSNIIYGGANRRCRMQTESNGQPWEADIGQNEMAAIVGILADGSVVAKINSAANPSAGPVVWAKGKTVEVLPWIPHGLVGDIAATANNLSRYAAFATKASESCSDPESSCKEDQLFIFDRKHPTPVVNYPFPRNGKVALSPDGLHYATFEANELKIYNLLP